VTLTNLFFITHTICEPNFWSTFVGKMPDFVAIAVPSRAWVFRLVREGSGLIAHRAKYQTSLFAINRAFTRIGMEGGACSSAS